MKLNLFMICSQEQLNIDQSSLVKMRYILSWLLLLLIYVAYLIFGSFVFHYTECPEEIKERSERRILAHSLMELQHQLNRSNSDILETVMAKVTNFDEFKNVKNINASEDEAECVYWDRVNSLFFSFTVVTTIGYGHLYPRTPEGRVACLLYAILGVPLNAILIGSLGAVFTARFQQYKRLLWSSLGSDDKDTVMWARVMKVLVESIIFTLFFTSVLMLIPAAIFTSLENNEAGDWDYLNSVYFTFITLSTIGFGDMVPDKNEDRMGDLTRWVYLMFIILWIILGMGYIFAVVEVIQETFRSTTKPAKKAWRGLRNQMFITDD